MLASAGFFFWYLLKRGYNFEPYYRKTGFKVYANNKCTVEPANQCSLTRAIVVRCVDSMLAIRTCLT